MEKFKAYKTVIWAVVLLLVASVLYLILSDMGKNKEKSKHLESLKEVPVQTITPEKYPIKYEALFKVEARHQFKVNSEVTGVLEKGDKDLLSATAFKKGQVIARINADQFLAELKSQKSSFKAKLVASMATIKFDYPECYSKWVNYLNKLTTDTPLPSLPKSSSEKESMYIVAQGIEESYYQIKSKEELLKKYTIVAPFDGVLNALEMKEGALISPSQMLGDFIGNNNFDLVTDVPRSALRWIKERDTLFLTDGRIGVVERLGNQIEKLTQSIPVYGNIEHSSLRHGDMVAGTIVSNAKIKGCIIDRKLLSADNTVLICNEGNVKKIAVELVNTIKEKALITGIEGPITFVLKTNGLHEGQQIEPVETE